MTNWTLKNKRALITGGSKGIGLAIAEEILALGGEVCIVARDQSLISDHVNNWQKQGLRAAGFSADLSSGDDIDRLFEDLNGHWGGIDILVNNVGTNVRKKVTEYDADTYKYIFDTNLHSAFEFCRHAYPLLKKTGDAAIVNVISVAGLTHLRTGAPYGMTKAALLQMTRNLAVEWADDGIRVNAVAPWYTETPLAKPVLDNPDYLADVLARTPMKRIAQAEEVATTAVFFCLPAASYVTGQCLAVDGGFTVNGF